MSTNTANTAFLKAALERKLLTQDQAGAVLAGVEQRRTLGIVKTAAEVAIESNVLSIEQVTQLQQQSRAQLPPERLAGFRVEHEIGRGAAGTVYRAKQVSLDKTVAIKVLHQSLSGNPKFVEQFMREAKTVGRLNHVHIVHAIDAGESNGFHYLAMELVEGETLKARIARSGTLSEAETLTMARAIAEGLECAHGQNLLHRDLKPDNILLGTNGQIKIADLGLAMPMEDAELMSEEHRRMGTPFYLSPEQAQGRALDERSEMYSVGATLYCCLTGKPPFTGNSVKEILQHHVQTPPTALAKAGARVSQPVADLVMRLLAKNPEDRPASASELIAELDAIENPRAGKRKPSVHAATGAAARAKPAIGAAKRPELPAQPTARAGAPRSSGGRGAPRAGRRTDDDENLAESLPATRPPPKKNVFTLSGTAVGVLLSIVFLMIAVNKQSKKGPPPSDSRAREEAAIAKEVLDKRIELLNSEGAVEKKYIEKLLADLERMKGIDDEMRLDQIWDLVALNAHKNGSQLLVDRIDSLRGSKLQSQLAGIKEHLAEPDRLVAEGKLMRAVEALDTLLQKLKVEQSVKDQLRERRQKIMGDLTSKVNADFARVKELRAKKEYPDAIEILKKIPLYADEQSEIEAERFLTELVQLNEVHIKAEAERRSTEDTRKYKEFVAELKVLTLERKFKDCISRALALDLTTKELTDMREIDLQAIQMLNDFDSDALRFLEQKAGTKDEFSIYLKDEKRPVVGTVAKIDRSSGLQRLWITVTSGGGKADVPVDLEKITDETLFLFVEKLHGPRSGKFLLPLGMLFTYRGLYDVAKAHFDKAATNGVDTEVWRKRMEWIRTNG
ncbi:MAG: serine/threonine protein kinase [Planctomycetota bacterium]